MHSNLAISLSNQMLTLAASNWKKKSQPLADCLVQQKLLFVDRMNAIIPILQMAIVLMCSFREREFCNWSSLYLRLMI